MSSMFHVAKESRVSDTMIKGPGIRSLGIAQARITGASAWRRDDLHQDNYFVSLTGACFDEIRRVADELRQFPLPTIVRRPEDFEMPACRATMGETRRMLRHGVRFAIVDRLPLDEIGTEAGIGIYWLLASMVARPVAQSLDGRLTYDVLDTGKQALPGRGTPRPDQYRTEIPYRQFLQRDASRMHRAS